MDAGIAPDPVRTHHLHQHAFAQSTVGDPKPLAWEGAADCLQDGTAREDKVGPFGADTGIVDALVVGHRQQALHYFGDLVVQHPATIDAPPVIALQSKMHARNGGDGAGRTEQMHRAGIVTGMFAREGRYVIAHLLDHRLETLARYVDATMPLRERNDPDRAERVEHIATRAIGISFVLLAGWVAYGSVSVLVNRDEPEASAVGLALTAVSLIVMPRLARRKRRVATALASRAAAADAVVDLFAELGVTR